MMTVTGVKIFRSILEPIPEFANEYADYFMGVGINSF